MQKRTIILATAILTLIILVSGIVVAYKTENKITERGGKYVDTDISSGNLGEGGVQAEIDRIMSDDSISILDWKIFTNTAYRWSMKVHPDAIWASNAPMNTELISANPSYSIDGQGSVLTVSGFENKNNLTIIDLIDHKSQQMINDRVKVIIDGQVYAVNWSELLFITLSYDNKMVYHININEFLQDDLRNRLIKSLRTFSITN